MATEWPVGTNLFYLCFPIKSQTVCAAANQNHVLAIPGWESMPKPAYEQYYEDENMYNGKKRQ